MFYNTCLQMNQIWALHGSRIGREVSARESDWPISDSDLWALQDETATDYALAARIPLYFDRIAPLS